MAVAGGCGVGAAPAAGCAGGCGPAADCCGGGTAVFAGMPLACCCGCCVGACCCSWGGGGGGACGTPMAGMPLPMGAPPLPAMPALATAAPMGLPAAMGTPRVSLLPAPMPPSSRLRERISTAFIAFAACRRRASLSAGSRGGQAVIETGACGSEQALMAGRVARRCGAGRAAAAPRPVCSQQTGASKQAGKQAQDSHPGWGGAFH